MRLAQPAVSYLMDHVVAGRCLLPGAAMFEAAAAAGATLAEASRASTCLTGISIPAPVVMQAGRLQTLVCLADASQGAVQLQEGSLTMPGGSSGQAYYSASRQTWHTCLTLPSRSGPLLQSKYGEIDLCCRCKNLPESSIQPCQGLCSVSLESLKGFALMDQDVHLPAERSCSNSVQVRSVHMFHIG